MVHHSCLRRLQKLIIYRSYFKTMNVGPAKDKVKTSNLAEQYLSN